MEADPILFAAVGIHPNSGTSWDSNTLDSLRELAGHPKVVAIGEIGLDYYRDRTPRELQKEILIEQLKLALEVDLPVILHVRNRSEEDRSCIEDLLLILEGWVASAIPPFSNRSHLQVWSIVFPGIRRRANVLLRLDFILALLAR